LGHVDEETRDRTPFLLSAQAKMVVLLAAVVPAARADMGAPRPVTRLPVPAASSAALVFQPGSLCSFFAWFDMGRSLAVVALRRPGGYPHVHTGVASSWVLDEVDTIGYPVPRLL
jgi:hypothetical protein